VKADLHPADELLSLAQPARPPEPLSLYLHIPFCSASNEHIRRFPDSQRRIWPSDLSVELDRLLGELEQADFSLTLQPIDASDDGLEITVHSRENRQTFIDDLV
jgi:hypothetical protein